MATYDCVVIGGGVSGMTVAYELHRQGREVLLIESSERLGGVMLSVETPDGYVLDCGPNTLANKDERLWQQYADLGIEGERLVAGPSNGRRFILLNGKPELVPTSPLGLLTTPLLSTRARLRILAEPFVQRAFASDETVAYFFARRIGVEPTQRLVDIFAGGVYANNPSAASMKAMFPSVWEAEQRAGSIIRGFIAAAREKKAGAPQPKKPRQKSQTYTFQRGLSTWPDAIVKAMGPDRVWLNSPAKTLRANGQGWELVVERESRTLLVQAGTVVVAAPAYAAAEIVAELSAPAAKALREIPYTQMAMVHMGFRREDVVHPCDGYGVLMPAVENHKVLGILFSSTLFAGRAPAGHVLTTTFVGGPRHLAVLEQDDAGVLATVLREHQQVLGLRGDPVMTHITRWPRAMAQYTLGHPDRIAAVAQLEEKHPGLYLTGSYRGGLGVPSCWRNSMDLVDRIVSQKATAPRESTVGA